MIHHELKSASGPKILFESCLAALSSTPNEFYQSSATAASGQMFSIRQTSIASKSRTPRRNLARRLLLTQEQIIFSQKLR